MLRLLRGVGHLLGCSLCLIATARGAEVSEFRDFSLRSGATTLLPGRLYVPPEASLPGASRPLIVFLHGAGESGTNNVAQINLNIDNLLAEAKRRGAFLYAPQTNGGWASKGITDQVMTMVDRVLVEQNVDVNRLYTTGLSMGGGGTWNLLNRYGERFAAGVPICGVAPASDFNATNLVDQAIAAFHARDDSVVSYQTSRNVINQILTAAGESLPTYPPIRSNADFEFISPDLDLAYIEPARGGHGIWPAVYNSAPMYEWLFSHSLAVPEPGAIALVSVTAVTIAGSLRRRHSLCAVA